MFGATAPWELLTQGATDDSTMNRAHAIAALGTIRTAQAEKLVEAGLMDKHSSVRLAAVIALAEKKSQGVRPRVVGGSKSGREQFPDPVRCRRSSRVRSF